MTGDHVDELRREIIHLQWESKGAQRSLLELTSLLKHHRISDSKWDNAVCRAWEAWAVRVPSDWKIGWLRQSDSAAE